MYTLVKIHNRIIKLIFKIFFFVKFLVTSTTTFYFFPPLLIPFFFFPFPFPPLLFVFSSFTATSGKIRRQFNIGDPLLHSELPMALTARTRNLREWAMVP